MLLFAVLGASSPSFAAGDSFEDSAVLGQKPASSVELVQTRITAYDQKGFGYQSQAGPKSGPGSETLHVLQTQGEFVMRQGENLTHHVWVPVDLVTSASADAIDRYYAKPDVVSRASAQNIAAEIDYQLTARAGSETTWTGGAGMHYEENFISWLYSLEYRRSLAEDNATLSLSANQALDWFDAFRLGGTRSGRTSRSTTNLNVGVSQLLSPTTIFGASYGLTLQRGELSNTWNSVPTVTGERLSEALPRQRDRHALSVSVLQWLPWQGTLELRYRFYRDDWRVTAHSVEVGLQQRLFQRLVLGANYRHHTQTGVFCFTTATLLTSNYRTADSDLAALDADALGGSATLNWPTARLGTLFTTFGYDYYFRSDELRVHVATWASGFRY
ncbi:MAG TPA: DUF3570 domain-containing protein [Polyangiaceae bacterium]|nr:DUF3570 domain-containing protein [Polyangiaceae bacterium]